MEPCAGERDESFEVDFELFVSCGEAVEVFEPREASLDAIALFIQGFVVGAWLFAVVSGSDDGDRAHSCDMLDDGIAVVVLVSQHRIGPPFSQQGDGLAAVVDLSGGYGQVQGQGQLVGEQMNLGCQTSSGTPQSLIFAPFFAARGRLLVSPHDGGDGGIDHQILVLPIAQQLVEDLLPDSARRHRLNRLCNLFYLQ